MPLIELVAGARPNLMKLAPVHRALAARDDVDIRVVHTGQHYDPNMHDVFFSELGIPVPEINLEVGSASHGVQTARVLERYENHVEAFRPDATVVFGDVNSTIACALAAVKLEVPVAHVEAGLRSFDRSMPEVIVLPAIGRQFAVRYDGARTIERGNVLTVSGNRNDRPHCRAHSGWQGHRLWRWAPPVGLRPIRRRSMWSLPSCASDSSRVFCPSARVFAWVLVAMITSCRALPRPTRKWSCVPYPWAVS